MGPQVWRALLPGTASFIWCYTVSWSTRARHVSSLIAAVVAPLRSDHFARLDDLFSTLSPLAEYVRCRPSSLSGRTLYCCETT